MTNSELIALLREVRHVVDGLESRYPRDDLLDRIDAALAAHEGEARVDVEWQSKHMGGPWSAQLGELELRIDWGGQYPVWSVSKQGMCERFAEAKSAAIEAAKGMK